VGLSVAEAGELCGLGETLLRREITAGRLKVIWIGRALIVPRTELDAWISRETERSTRDAAVELPRDLQLLQAITRSRYGLQLAREAGADLEKIVALVKAERAEAGAQTVLKTLA
jgi:excisionase family DNA binding protein